MLKSRRAGLLAAVFGYALTVTAPPALAQNAGQGPISSAPRMTAQPGALPALPPAPMQQPSPAAPPIALSAPPGSPAPAGANETLADAIALAYATNPNLLTQRSVLQNSDEAFFRSRANLGPTITADVSLSSSTDNDLVNGGGGSSSAGLNAGLSVNQTLYSGGRLAAAMESQRLSLLSSRESLRSSEQSVLQQVVEAYTGVRRAEQQLAIASQQATVLGQQQNESQTRYDVGAATITEVEQANARLAGAGTQVISAQNTLANARAQYLTVVGKNPEQLAPEPGLEAYLPSGLGEAFEVAQRNNPALRQAYLSERQSAQAIVTARAARRPNVSLRSGVSASGAPSSSIPGLFDDIGSAGVTTSLNLSVPIFAGRTTSSSIRSAENSNRQDNLAIEARLRTLNQQVTSAWNALVAARAQIQSQEEQVRATRLATQGTREEQLVGLRTSLDLLNAEQEQRQAEQSLVNAQFNKYTAEVSLLVAMGVLSPLTFGAEVELYDPEVHFQRINAGGLPWEGLIEQLDRIGSAPPPVRAPLPGEVVPEFVLPVGD